MADKTIYYFSGAGNSLAVAKRLAGELGTQLLPMKVLRERNGQPAHTPRPAANDASENLAAGSVIGIVFPVHGGRPPKFVIEALGNLPNIQETYVFAVCTYGISPGRALHRVGELVKEKGGTLAAGFSVGMPQSGIGSARIGDERMQYLWREARQKTTAVSQFLQERRCGVIESQSAYGPMLKKENLKMVPAVFKMLGNMIRYGAKNLTQIADENCIGCGTCASICPADNIHMQDDHPVWLDHCVGCFGCYHWCPQGAVSFGGHDMDTVQFHHPDVSVGDMIGHI
jgi:ferredoxin